jgi:molybdopterin-guanine dinucleotide biosynthesis protein A
MGAGFNAVVLAGGTAARLDGLDKGSLELGGRTLLARAIEAVVDAAEVVVVGDPVPTERPVSFTREEPRLGGPLAAVVAGCAAFARAREWVVVIACDMPYLVPSTVGRLLDQARLAPGTDGAVLLGPDGRAQLAFVVRSQEVEARADDPEPLSGAPLFGWLAGLRLAPVAAQGHEHRDVDTWSDLRDLGADPPA